MHWKLGKRAKRSVQEKMLTTSALEFVDPATIVSSREAKIILYDIMQPRVILRRIQWPCKGEVSRASGPDSETESFQGFSSNEKLGANRDEPAIQNGVLAASADFQVYLKEIGARLAEKNANKIIELDEPYIFYPDEDNETIDDYESTNENVDSIVCSGETLTATDSDLCSPPDVYNDVNAGPGSNQNCVLATSAEFQAYLKEVQARLAEKNRSKIIESNEPYTFDFDESLTANDSDLNSPDDCNDANAGPYAMVGEAIDETQFEIDTFGISDLDVSSTVEVCVENASEHNDGDSNDEFHDAEDGGIQDVFVDHITQNGVVADADTPNAFAYESDDSWNSADSFNQSLKNIGNDDNRIMLLCPENMDESNSQDGLDDEFGNREELENSRPLLTDILDLIESNRSVNRTENGNRIESIHLFCNICIRNLIDGCYDVNCGFGHTLPPKHIVLENLESASMTEVNEAYAELLLQYPKLFDQYFQVFCIFYGRKKVRTQLRDMSHVCVDSEKAESFMQDVVNAFESTGMPYSTSVDVLIREMASRSHDTRYQMLVLYVALNSRNTKLMVHLRQLEPIFTDENVLGHEEAVEKLIKISLEVEIESITLYALLILKKCTMTTFLRLNQALLRAFLENARMAGHREALLIMYRISAASNFL